MDINHFESLRIICCALANNIDVVFEISYNESMKTDKLYIEIGQNIKTARSIKAMSQEELADKLGIKRTSVSNIENGKQRLPLHLIYEICDLLKLDVHKVIPSNRENAKDLNLSLSGHTTISISQNTLATLKKYSTDIDSMIIA